MTDPSKMEIVRRKVRDTLFTISTAEQKIGNLLRGYQALDDFHHLEELVEVQNRFASAKAALSDAYDICRGILRLPG